MFNVSSVILPKTNIRIYEEIKTKCIETHNKFKKTNKKISKTTYNLYMLLVLFNFTKQLEEKHKISIWKGK